jgi:phosphoglycolate phosphatase
MHTLTKLSTESIPSVFGVIHPNPAPGQVRVAVFDFDGTISLLRAGWQHVMIDMFVRLVPRRDGEREQDIRQMAQEMVHRTNGQPTILQMQELADTIRARDTHALTANEYKTEFLKRLRLQTDPRLAAIQSSRTNAERWQMPGVCTLLEILQTRGVTCYIASGTDEHAVKHETALLGLDEYFAGIYGARDDFAAS